MRAILLEGARGDAERHAHPKAFKVDLSTPDADAAAVDDGMGGGDGAAVAGAAGAAAGVEAGGEAGGEAADGGGEDLPPAPPRDIATKNAQRMAHQLSHANA